MRDRPERRPTQRTLTFDRHEVWPALPDLVQRQCGDLIGQLLRAVLQREASPRSHDERQDSPRSS
jgi:hypothetical protein